jgi:hypothetical protein
MLQPGADVEGRATPGHVDGRVRASERQLRVAAQCSGCLDKHAIRFRTNERLWPGYCSSKLDHCTSQKHLHSAG